MTTILNPEFFATYLVAASIVIAAPGPDSMNTLAIGMARGRREAMAYALGVGIGCLTHTLWAVLGISAIVAASETLFGLVKWVGVAYLLWLGIQSLRERRTLPVADDRAARVQAPIDASTRVLQGALTNALNPKVMLFFMAFLPQFADARLGAVGAQMLVMGLVFAVITAIAYVLLGAGAGGLGERLMQRPSIAQWLNRITGVLFIGLALRLMLAERR
ncbi:MAG: LysE family translocator [Rhizobacter sp.]|jgi:threonine/homoserine/homoserine lactone efflux protein|nr:LysE family translocator [Rhizobacter sp.]